MQVGFHLWDGKEMGDFVSVTVRVTPSAHSSYPNELVLNGSYEAGTEVKTGITLADFQNSTIPNSAQIFSREGRYARGRTFADAHPFFSYDWEEFGHDIVIKNSAYSQGCTNPISVPFGGKNATSPFPYPDIHFSTPLPTTQGGERFAEGEVFYSTLKKPMKSCKLYKLKFQLNTNMVRQTFHAGTAAIADIYFMQNMDCDYPNANIFKTSVDILASNDWQDIEPGLFCRCTPAR